MEQQSIPMSIVILFSSVIVAAIVVIGLIANVVLKAAG
jgi:hypothetical protein